MTNKNRNYKDSFFAICLEKAGIYRTNPFVTVEGNGRGRFFICDQRHNYSGWKGALAMEDTAVLSSFDKYTTFSFGGKTLTFRTCDGLERYVKVLTWDNGYLEVLAKYRQSDSEIEEYIDLEPVLKRLYMDKTSFLKPIKNVRIDYVKERNTGSC